MLESQPSPEAAELLKRFTDAGGVVEFVFFDCTEETEDVQAESTHREAVVAGLYVLQQRFGAYTKISSLNPRIQESVWRIQIDAAKANTLHGKRISRAEFLGEQYDHQRGGLIVHEGRSVLGIGSGFAYAFSDTPNGFRLKPPERGQLFEQVCSTVLGGITDDSIIFEWPTDWSSYFEAGHEWWGSFLWSLGHAATGRIVVIVSSTTD